jgi:hypothetical protein
LNESVNEGQSKQEPENFPSDFDNGHHQQDIKLPDSVKPVNKDHKNPNETQIKDDNKNSNVSIMLEKLKQEEERKHNYENYDFHRKHSTMTPTAASTIVPTNTYPSIIGYSM